MPSPGDKCRDPKCNGQLRVRTSRHVLNYVERRLECNRCQKEGGIQVVDESRVFRRERVAS